MGTIKGNVKKDPNKIQDDLLEEAKIEFKYYLTQLDAKHKVKLFSFVADKCEEFMKQQGIKP